MFENEESEDYELSDFESWYDKNFIYFKRESKKQLGPTLDISLFYTGVYRPFMQEISPAIHKLMLKQYPVIDTEFRPLILEYIDWIVSIVGNKLMLNLYILIQDQKESINLRQKYPDFESWIDIYAKPGKPDLVSEKDFQNFSIFTDQERNDLIDEENKDIIELFGKEQNLMKEFYDLIQPLVFKYYQALQNLDYDGWIIYAVQIREEYRDYKFRCEYIEKFIEYDFQEEDIHLKYDEFQAKFRIKYNEKWEREHHLPESGIKGNNSSSQNEI